MICPNCSSKLEIKHYENVEVDYCPSCHGYWLDEGELSKIVETKDEEFSLEIISETIRKSFAGVPEGEIQKVRKCPKCDAELQPVNYAYSSGIIVDKCPHHHGVWLDHEEIEKVQAHAERWNEIGKKKSLEWSELVKSVKVDDNNSGEESLVKELIDRLVCKIFGL